ncbi:MAG: DEAD/DEAH box helicase [Nitrososphaerales archaeon]
MYKYRCPKCGGSLNIAKIFDGRRIVKCNKCSIADIFLPKSDSNDEAYLNFLERYDNELINPKEDLIGLLEREGILRREEDVIKMVEKSVNFYLLPELLKQVLLSKQDYMVSYNLMEREEPKIEGDIYSLPLDPRLIKALEDRGIKNLYDFQFKAIKEILSGKNLIIVAPTGAGKTEAFTLPIFQKILEDKVRGVRALFLYPTKALARDQLPKLQALGKNNIRVEVFDGDVPKSLRDRIISDPPEVIVSNIDILHLHMMYRTQFSNLLRGVRYLVLDELHTYLGTFGSNAYFILKRLKRITKDLQLIGASATIANPKEFGERLFGSDVEVIYGERGKRGRIHFCMLFPTLRGSRALILDLIKRLYKDGHRFLVFSSSHIGSELNAFFAKRDGIKIDVHRAGLSAQHRRRVENEFKSGIINCISTTPTLELGIDIGDMDSIISDMVPINRVIQRIGRIGRRGQESLAFLILNSDSPIGQYYRKNPEQYFKDFEQAYLDPKNPVIAKKQILAMSMDKPLRREEVREYFNILEELREEGLIIERGNNYFPNYRKALRLLKGYNIRGAGYEVSIYFGDKRVGERSLPIAIEELHPEAIYFLGGKRYRVKSLSLEREGGKAYLEPLPQNYPYYTRAFRMEYPRILEVHERKIAFDVEVAYCTLDIDKKIMGYFLKEMDKDGKGELRLFDIPTRYQFITKGIVFRAPEPLETLELNKDRIEYVLASSYHASEHVIIEGTNSVTGGGAIDMGGIAMGTSGLIFIYDGSIGGNGASKALFDRFERACHVAKEILDNCPCEREDGCPRCTYSYRCGNNNQYLHKLGSKEVYEKVINRSKTRIIEPYEGEKPYV